MTGIRSVADLVRSHEGLRLAAYDDATGDPVPVGGTAKGTLTIGYGHTGSGVQPGQVCTTSEAEAWLAWDLAIAGRRAAQDLGAEAWALLDAVRRAALQDMAFEMGGKGLAGFVHMLTAVRLEDWATAHDEALTSDWAETAPNRARCDATMLLTGAWPSPA